MRLPEYAGDASAMTASASATLLLTGSLVLVNGETSIQAGMALLHYVANLGMVHEVCNREFQR